MLVFKDKTFIKTPFDNEAELESLVISKYESLFGPDSFFVDKTRISTGDGVKTVPDGFVIDIRQKRWYIVEVELGHHDVWNHIAKQVSKQIVASMQDSTKQKLERVLTDFYKQDDNLKEKFTNLDIEPVDVVKTIQEILKSDPIIGIPIDHIPSDLKDWAVQQKLTVRLWLIHKYIELGNKTSVIYELPEEYRPEIDTEEKDYIDDNEPQINRYDVELIDLVHVGLLQAGEVLVMRYRPRNGELKTYEALLLPDGTLQVMGQTFGSPTYAALIGIKDSGSTRSTVNGWTAWKTQQGFSLAELREQFLEAAQDIGENHN